MFCPQCGNAQPVDEVMYCSICGFTLRGVQRLLLTGGEEGAAETETDEISMREILDRRGVKQGLVLWMIGAFVLPLLATTDAPKSVMGAAAVVFFVGGFLRMLYALLFHEAQQRASSQPSHTQDSMSAPAALTAKFQKSKRNITPPVLPAAPVVNRLDTTRHRTTGQLVQPPSVTEHTTRLLDNNESR